MYWEGENETLKKVQERRKRKCVLNNSRTRASKTAAEEKYKEAHKAVTKSIREDKRRFIEGLPQESEGAAPKGDMKQLYDTSKMLIGKYQQLAGPIKNKERNLLTNSDAQMKRWAEHF